MREVNDEGREVRGERYKVKNTSETLTFLCIELLGCQLGIHFSFTQDSISFYKKERLLAKTEYFFKIYLFIFWLRP